MALQYSSGSISSGPTSFHDVPPEVALFSGFSAIVSPHKLLPLLDVNSNTDISDAHSQREPVAAVVSAVVLYFRVSMVVGDRQLHGPQSNPIVVVPDFLEAATAQKAGTLTVGGGTASGTGQLI